jgi:hypothetical protein
MPENICRKRTSGLLQKILLKRLKGKRRISWPERVGCWPVASFRQDGEFSRYRAYSGHGPTCRRLDPVANDPELTFSCELAATRVLVKFLCANVPGGWD